MSSKKKPKKSIKKELSLEEELILEIIKNEARRPKFIARASKFLTQNEVVHILNELEEKGLVERASQKAWMMKTA